jgi:putative sterol carrier protein
MVDVIEEFFAELMESEYEPMLSRGSGSIRVDVEDGHATRRWLISVDRGAVSVSRRNGRADCVLRADAATFERLATGELNPLATMLRGGVQVEMSTNSELLVLFQRYVGARIHQVGIDRDRQKRAGAAPKGRKR